MMYTYLRYLILFFVPYVVFSQGDVEKEELMYTFFDMGYEQIYVHRDSAYHYLESALNMANEIDDHDSQLGILDHIIITADYHFDLKKYRTTLDRVDMLLTEKDIEEKVEDIESWRIAYLSNLGGYYYKAKEYVKAKALFLKVRSHFKDIPPEKLSYDQGDRLYSANSYLGTIYKHLAKYELSEQYYLRNVALVDSCPAFGNDSDSFLTGVHQLMAQLYTLMGKHAEANQLYDENLKWAKEYYSKDKMYKNNVVNAFQKITLGYIEQDSLQKALYFLNQSRPYLLADDPFYKDALILYGDIYSGLQDEQNALDNYRRALNVFTEFRDNKPHQDIANINGKIAEFYLKQKKYREGLETITEAFNSSGSNIQLTGSDQSPDPSEVFSKTQLLQLLDVKLQLLQGNYNQTKKADVQKLALKTCNAILKTFDQLKSEFDSKLDKQFLAEKAYPIFHRLLEVAHTAYESDASSETFQLALNIAEKNKDFVLLEALRNAQATQYGNVPQKVLDKEARLRAEITHGEKEIFDAADANPVFSNNLFNLKQEYYSFLDTIKTNYPKYHELKYQTTSLNLENVRKKVLEDNGTLISYTMTDRHLYAIVLNGSGENFLRLPFSESHRESVRKFYRLLANPSIDGNENIIFELGETLHERLLKRPLEESENKNLTIIPDGELHYLPFDLLSENGSYLLETKNIGYGNSVTSLLELRQKKKNKTNRILAFAPTFKGKVAETTDRQFGKLLYNDDEVNKIEAFYDTETVLAEKATLKNFTSKTSGFNVLHLATHASANDEYPDYSYLAFTEEKDSAQSNILYIKDLYNATLNADMVTLSACQTGIGKLQKGQGMLSLSKGFYYAGAKSLVNTLWKINDKSTVRLMEYFYEGLSNGESKTEALRSAKMKYLETTDDNLLRHPYYWAAFVASGDVSPITETNYWGYIIAGLVFFVILFFILKGKNRKGRFKRFSHTY